MLQKANKRIPNYGDLYPLKSFFLHDDVYYADIHELNIPTEDSIWSFPVACSSCLSDKALLLFFKQPERGFKIVKCFTVGLTVVSQYRVSSTAAMVLMLVRSESQVWERHVENNILTSHLTFTRRSVL